METKIIGKIKVKVNGELQIVEVSDDGFMTLEDGTQRKIPEEQFRKIVDKISSTPAPPASQHKPLAAPYMEDFESPPVIPTIPQPIPEEQPQIPTKQIPVEKPAPQPPAVEPQIKKNSPKNKVLHKLLPLILTLIVGGCIGWGVAYIKPTAQSEIHPIQSPSPSPEQQPIEEDDKPITDAKKILIVAKIIDENGKEEEVILGYFTVDEDIPTADGLNFSGTDKKELKSKDSFLSTIYFPEK